MNPTGLDNMDIYFTADLHFSHRNVIKYAHRPFHFPGTEEPDVKQMDETLITNWNARVRPNDTIYFLGDFAFCPPWQAEQILKQLHGEKYWIFGNHDKKLRKDPSILAHFKWAKDFAEIKVPDLDAHGGVQRLTLCHYAMRVWNQSHYGAWQLYGHSHGSLPDDPNSLSMDVGVDANYYFPISYEEVKAAMKKKTFKPIDHHDRERR